MSEATKQRIEELLKEGRRRSEVAREVGVSASTITRTARLLGFSDVAPRASHFEWPMVQAHYDEGHSIEECRAIFGFSYGAWDKAVSRGDLIPRPRSEGQLSLSTRELVEDLLARGRSQAEIARELSLEGCGITEWRGMPISLQLHHRNGDGLDNRIENLEILCGNCHSQTDNWGGRNRGWRKGRPDTLF